MYFLKSKYRYLKSATSFFPKRRVPPTKMAQPHIWVKDMDTLCSCAVSFFILACFSVSLTNGTDFQRNSLIKKLTTSHNEAIVLPLTYLPDRSQLKHLQPFFFLFSYKPLRQFGLLWFLSLLWFSLFEFLHDERQWNVILAKLEVWHSLKECVSPAAFPVWQSWRHFGQTLEMPCSEI